MHTTVDFLKRIGITKAGNGRVRTLLVESAWTYRYPARIGKRKLYRLEHNWLAYKGGVTAF
ncbi:transposase [Rhizobium mongolense]|uniref:Transposase n=1 Tax=Rhizobium mongolense TaxID=57676 RepID=A0ABR6IFW4_9HYPH|nr:transposase [Rhizobium mongolense]